MIEPSVLHCATPGWTSKVAYCGHTKKSPPRSLSLESRHPESVPRIIDVTDTLPENVPGSAPRFDDDFSSIPEGVPGGNSHVTLSAPSISDLPDDGIEELTIQAATEASKREAELGPDNVVPQNRQSQLEDPELEHAVPLSLKYITLKVSREGSWPDASDFFTEAVGECAGTSMTSDTTRDKSS
ncbi:hypothetical protein Tco_0947075 [Tanacetum coccineum]